MKLIFSDTKFPRVIVNKVKVFQLLFIYFHKTIKYFPC